MSREAVKEFIRSRPSIFWWTLLNALAAAFAVASWSICLYLFKFPERPTNYDVLRKLQRLTPVVAFDPLEAEDGTSAEPQDLLKRFYSLPDDQLAAYNRHFKRNYLTNFAKPEVVNYVEGSYRVTGARLLTPQDLFHPGLVVRAQATVLTDELTEPSPYPVIIELLLPTAEDPAPDLFPAGHVFTFSKVDHRAYILHAARIGSPNEPTACLTVVPLAYPNYLAPDGAPLALAPPDPLNMAATFPVMEQDRVE